MVLNKKISIIVPVYNTEKYLPRCIESLCTQTYSNLEIIFVDDASPDKSVDIIKDSMKHDVRIRYVKHSKNKGLFQARVTGSKQATGDYIAFVDSDDYVSLDFYHCLLKKTEQYKADIIIGKTVFEKTDGTQYERNLHNNILEFDVLKSDEIKRAYFGQQGYCYSWHTIWNKLYAKNLWDKCLPYFESINEHIIMTEDIAFSSILFYEAQCISKIESEAYFYCENETASTNAKKISFSRYQKNMHDMQIVFDFVDSYLNEKKCAEHIKSNFLEFRKYYSRMWRELGEVTFSGKEKKQVRELMERFLPKYEAYLNQDDHFFASIETKWNGGLEHLKKRIYEENVKYISFDIFDTVVMRPVYQPEDVFLILEQKFYEIYPTNVNFSVLRTGAEQEARREIGSKHLSYQDITLDEIYHYFSEYYGIPANIAEQMKKAEKELEIELCTQRKAAKELYDVALLSGKKVIFTSDMYLDRSTIEAILNKTGYQIYEQLFLSSEERVTKNSGDLYHIVKKQLQVSGNQILHIGDTWQNDITNAENCGIKTLFFPKYREVFENKITGVITNSCSNIAIQAVGSIQNEKKLLESFGYRTMLAVVAMNYFDNPYRSFNENSDFNADPYFIGYYTLGMHLIGLTSWIQQNVAEKHYKTIHFMSRDGYLPLKAYQLIEKYFPNLPDASYIYSSRRAVLPAMIKTKADFYDLPVEYRNHSPKTIFKLLDFCTGNYKEEEIKKAGFLPEKTFYSLEEFRQFIHYYLEHWYSETEHKKALALVQEYYLQNLSDSSCTFDLGYSGRIQAAISHSLNRGIDVFFVHSDAKRAELLSLQEKFKIHSFYDFTPYVTGAFREHILSDCGPSCIGFCQNGDNLDPIFEQEEKNFQDVFIISLLQKGALDFVNTFYKYFASYSEILTFKAQEVSLPYEGYIHYAKDIDLKIWTASYFEDKVYGARSQIRIYDFVKNEARDFLSRTNGNTFLDNSEVLEQLSDGKNRYLKAFLYLCLDQNLFKEKVKGKLYRHPQLFRLCKKFYHWIK